MIYFKIDSNNIKKQIIDFYAMNCSSGDYVGISDIILLNLKNKRYFPKKFQDFEDYKIIVFSTKQSTITTSEDLGNYKLENDEIKVKATLKVNNVSKTFTNVNGFNSYTSIAITKLSNDEIMSDENYKNGFHLQLEIIENQQNGISYFQCIPSDFSYTNAEVNYYFKNYRCKVNVNDSIFDSGIIDVSQTQWIKCGMYNSAKYIGKVRPIFNWSITDFDN